MHKKIRLTTFLVMILSLVWGSSAAQFAGGSGTILDPYQISTPEQLDSVRNYLNGQFILVNDIDLDIAQYNSGFGWNPIGDDVAPFTGALDGNGFTIQNLFINRSSDYVGFFGRLSIASVENISFQNVDITGGEHTGSLVGQSFPSNTISNIHSTGNVTGGRYTGGIVGLNNSSSIEQSSFKGVVTGGTYAAGIAGYHNNQAQISNCYSEGVVNGSNWAGGIAGFMAASSIDDSYSTSNIISGNRVGGLVGGNQFSSTIIDSYSSGVVLGNPDIGGLVGYNRTSIINDSFWNEETSGLNLGIGLDDNTQSVTGLTSAEMRQQASFSNWDFISTWDIQEGMSFPFLKNNQPDSLPGQLELGPIAISQVFPEAAAAGNLVYVYGANFCTTATDQQVTIGGVSATVLEAYGNYIVVEVPELAPGLHTVSVTKDGVTDELINAFQFLIPSAANFESEQFLFAMNDIINLHSGDFNNNGDIDLIMNSGALNQVNIRYNNQNFQFTSITNIHPNYQNHDVHPVDIDGDGDLDAVASLITQTTPTVTSDDRLVWFRNNGPTNNPTYTEFPISTSINGARDIFTADMDGDGDKDVIATSTVTGTVMWFRNDDAFFNESFIITANALGVSCVHAADLNNDGLMDVLSGTGSNQTVSWYPNEGNGVFTQKIDIISGEQNVCTVVAADFDNDGYMDVLTHGDENILWFRNDGTGDFSDRRFVTDSFILPSEYQAADLDGDGDQDVIAASFDNGTIAWFQNLGDGRFSSANEMPTTLDRAYAIDAADYDNDGDIDVIVGQRFASDGPGAYLFENTSISNNPIASYPFNGNSQDVSGNGYTLFTNGDEFLTTDRSGAIDSAYFFDGDFDYFNTVPTEPFDLETFTYSTWINPYDLPDNGTLGVFLAKQTPNVQTGLLMYFFPDGRLSTTIYDASGNYTRPSSYTANIGEWIHYTVTYDGNRLQTYINGQPDAGQDFGITPIYDNAPLTVGGYNRANNTFKGKMEEVLVYGQALTASEVQAIYDSQVPTVFDNTSQWTSIITTDMNGKKSSAEFGTTPTSSDGFDPAVDIPLPPAPNGDYVQLFFAHPEFGGTLGDNYRSDYKTYSDYETSNSSWELSLFSTFAGSDTLFISRPAGFTAPIKVIDENGIEFISLAGDLEVLYTISTGETQLFDIIVGDIFPPEIELRAIMDGPQIWDKTFTRDLNWTITDPSGITNITTEVSYDGGSNWSVIYSGLDAGFSFTPDQAIGLNESTLFRVSATDGASTNFTNSATVSGTKFITIVAPTQNLDYQTGWQMVGSPFANEIDPTSVISDAIRYQWDTSSFEYLLTDSYPSREGIWLGAYQNGTDILTGEVGESDTTITVKAGWNMATSPLFRNVKVDSISVFDGSTTQTYADAVSNFLITSPQGYNGSGYVVADELEFFSSYWMGVTVDSLILTLPIHDFASPTPAPPSAPGQNQHMVSEENKLSLMIIDGEFEQSLQVRIGGDPSQPAPPPAPNAYRVGFLGESTILGNLYSQFSLSDEDLDGIEIPFLLDGPEREVTLSWYVEGFDNTPISLKSDGNLPLEEENGTLELSVAELNATKLAFGEFAVNKEQEIGIPAKFSLAQNYPNPFNPSTNISFALPQRARVTLEVFSITGQRVGMLVNETLSAGNHTIQFDASGLSSGTYLYRIQAGNFVQTRKMVLVK